MKRLENLKDFKAKIFRRMISFSQNRVRQKSLFSFSDYKPWNRSAPVQKGLEKTLTRLKEEFGGAGGATPRPSTNLMEMIGNFSVGQNISLAAARTVVIVATWRNKTFTSKQYMPIPIQL